MDPKHLRTLVTVIEMQSFTRAGRRLGLSQSATSQQIGSLERHLGVKLLHRDGTGARPTPAGETLLPFARQILRKINDARRVLAEFESPASGVLRIGAATPLCQRLLPAVLKEYRSRFPRVDLHILGGHTAVTVQRLLAGEIDIGLVTLPVEATKVRLLDLGRDELVVIAPPGHPWAGRTRVHAQDLASEALIVWGPRCRTAALIKQVLLSAGVFPRIAIELDDLRGAIEMVHAGLGVSVVPRWAVDEPDIGAPLIVLPMGKGGLDRSWAVATLDVESPPQILRAFVRLCADLLPPTLAA